MNIYVYKRKSYMYYKVYWKNLLKETLKIIHCQSAMQRITIFWKKKINQIWVNYGLAYMISSFLFIFNNLILKVWSDHKILNYKNKFYSLILA